MNQYKRGVTTIEILVSICIIAIVLILLFGLLVQVRHEDEDNAVQSNFILNQSTFIRLLEEDIVNYGVKSISPCTLGEANIATNTIATGYENKYQCVRITYAADYIKDKIGYLLIYNYYRSYEGVGDSYKGSDNAWMLSYMRGSYSKCDTVTNRPISSSFKSETATMREIPSEVILDDVPYVLYTAMSSGTNAASMVIPVQNDKGEHYDINLSFTFQGNNHFACDNSKPTALECKCLSSDGMCNKTYNYSNTCTN